MPPTNDFFQFLSASGEISNDTFDRFIELGPQLVQSLLGVQDALGLKTGALQKLPRDEHWGRSHAKILTSLTECVGINPVDFMSMPDLHGNRNLTRYLKVVMKLPTASSEKIESFTFKLDQYVRKFNNLARKLTVRQFALRDITRY